MMNGMTNLGRTQVWRYLLLRCATMLLCGCLASCYSCGAELDGRHLVWRVGWDTWRDVIAIATSVESLPAEGPEASIADVAGVLRDLEKSGWVVSVSIVAAGGEADVACFGFVRAYRGRLADIVFPFGDWNQRVREGLRHGAELHVVKGSFFGPETIMVIKVDERRLLDCMQRMDDERIRGADNRSR